jgi:hypothetical protein
MPIVLLKIGSSDTVEVVEYPFDLARDSASGATAIHLLSRQRTQLV